MGFFDRWGPIGILEATVHGDTNFTKDIKNFGKLGRSGYEYGRTITEEGLAGLRDLDRTFEGRLKDPLGEVGRGVFARARGAISDDAIRSQRGFQFRAMQRALQQGGTMSPEALAELEMMNRRDIDEARFGAERDLGIAEGEMTLTETGKLFDRMSDIRKTILGVGQNEKIRGMSAILAALGLRLDRNKAIAGTIMQGVGIGMSAGGTGGGVPAGGVWG